jgi:hypothetical protein
MLHEQQQIVALLPFEPLLRQRSLQLEGLRVREGTEVDYPEGGKQRRTTGFRIQ